MAMTVIITLTTAGEDTGPFFALYSNVDNFVTSFATVTKSALLAGYVCNTVPDGTTRIRVKSHDNPYCTNYIDLDVITTTTTSTTFTTTSTTTTVIPVYTLSYDIYNSDSPECGTCPMSNGEIKVDGVSAFHWLASHELPLTGPIAANPGQTVTVSADCYAVGSGCINIQATLTVFANGVVVASAIDGPLNWSMTFDHTTIISIVVGCIAPEQDPEFPQQ